MAAMGSLALVANVAETKSECLAQYRLTLGWFGQRDTSKHTSVANPNESEMTFLLYKTRTARKTHDCAWCTEPIMPGENYIDERAVYCGDFQALKFHPECKNACTQMAKQNHGDFDLDFRCKRGSMELV